MKHFNIDWADFVKHLPAWHELSDEFQRCLMALKWNEQFSMSAFPDEDPEPLIERGLLGCNPAGTHVRVGVNGREFFKAMRAMNRHWQIAERFGEVRCIDDYASDHLTVDEQAALIRSESPGVHSYHYAYGGRPSAEPVTHQAWLDDWLSLKTAPQALKWERYHLPKRPVGDRFDDGAPYFDSKAVFEATRALIEAALTWPEPARIEELPQRLPKIKPRDLWRALMPAVRYLLLFPRFDIDDHQPRIGIWPGISFLLHRPKPVLPSAIEPAETFHAPYRIEDMTSVLVAAAEEPLRLLASGHGLYQKDFQRLVERMMPTPTWVFHELDENDLSDVEELLGDDVGGTLHDAVWKERAYEAVTECIHQELLLIEETAKGTTIYETTEQGRDWLASDLHQRIAGIVEPWRREPPAEEKGKRETGEHVKHVSEFDVIEVYRWICSPWMPPRLRNLYDKKLFQIDWRGAFTDALADVDQFQPVGSLLEYHSRVNNPLLGRRHAGSYGQRPKATGYGYQIDGTSDLHMERLWFDLLARTIERQLLPLGGVEMGWRDGELSIRLHPIGRYMLGLTDDFHYEAQAEGAVIVQPNFEVTFMGPAPAAEATIGRLAERTGQRMGAMFRITRGSVLAAAAAGIPRDDALRDLEQATAKPLPDNVRREIIGWFNSVARVGLREAWIVDAPDEPTAARVLAAAGKKARRLTPTTIEIVAKRSTHTALFRKLKQAGVFVKNR